MKLAATATVVALLLLSGCASTPIDLPFTKSKVNYDQVPAEDLRQLALAIESAIQSGDKDAVIENVGSVKIDTPEIQQAIRSRILRGPLVSAFLDTGHAYENRSGLLAIKRSSEYKNFGTSQERDRNALIVMSENNNRWTLYEGIVNHSGFAGSARGAVQDTFLNARIEVMKPGQRYEAEDGSILAK